jgi:hypothetical protein
MIIKFKKAYMRPKERPSGIFYQKDKAIWAHDLWIIRIKLASKHMKAVWLTIGVESPKTTSIRRT